MKFRAFDVKCFISQMIDADDQVGTEDRVKKWRQNLKRGAEKRGTVPAIHFFLLLHMLVPWSELAIIMTSELHNVIRASLQTPSVQTAPQNFKMF